MIKHIINKKYKYMDGQAKKKLSNFNVQLTHWRGGGRWAPGASGRFGEEINHLTCRESNHSPPAFQSVARHYGECDNPARCRDNPKKLVLAVFDVCWWIHFKVPFFFGSRCWNYETDCISGNHRNLCDRGAVPGDNEGNMAGLSRHLLLLVRFCYFFLYTTLPINIIISLWGRMGCK